MALSETEFNELIREYRHKRQNKIDEAKAVKEKVYSENLRLREIELEIENKSIKFAIENLKNKNKSLDDYKKYIKRLNDEKNEILKRIGFENGITPKFECALCEDTGYVNGEMCSCFKKRITEILYKSSHLGDVLKDENFEKFNVNYYSEKIVDTEFGVNSKELAIHARNRSIKFVRDFDNQYNNILFYGNVGAGKTFLSHCIAKVLLDRGKRVVYLTAFSFFDITAKEKFSGYNGIKSEYSKSLLMDADLLIIDDLGTELVNSFTNSELFAFINERMLKKKAMIISTNLDLKSFSELYGERIFSRIEGNFEFIKLIGNDIRKIKLGGE